MNNQYQMLKMTHYSPLQKPLRNQMRFPCLPNIRFLKSDYQSLFRLNEHLIEKRRYP